MLGNAQILEVFNISKVGKVAGCRVTDGRVERGANVRLIRDNVVIHEGKLSTLKRFKDEVKEVAGRPGMRHGLRELPGHARRRRHRVLPRRGDQADAVSSTLRPAKRHRPASSRHRRRADPSATFESVACDARMPTSARAVSGVAKHRGHKCPDPSSQAASRRSAMLRVGRARSATPSRECSDARRNQSTRCSSAMSSPCPR